MSTGIVGFVVDVACPLLSSLPPFLFKVRYRLFTSSSDEYFPWKAGRLCVFFVASGMGGCVHSLSGDSSLL